MGQKKEVFVEKLIVQDSLEEMILEYKMSITESGLSENAKKVAEEEKLKYILKNVPMIPIDVTQVTPNSRKRTLDDINNEERKRADEISQKSDKRTPKKKKARVAFNSPEKPTGKAGKEEIPPRDSRQEWAVVTTPEEYKLRLRRRSSPIISELPLILDECDVDLPKLEPIPIEVLEKSVLETYFVRFLLK